MIAAFLAYLDSRRNITMRDARSGVRREIEQKLMKNAYKVVCSTNAPWYGN